VRRFVLKSNIGRFEELLKTEADAPTREWLITSLADARRQLARVSAAEQGVRWGPPPFGSRLQRAGSLRSDFEKKLQSSQHSLFLLEPGPGLHIVDMSEPFARASMVDRDAVAGQLLFDVYPDNPGDEHATGVSNLFASIMRAADSGRPDVMPVQRYDVRAQDGGFVERYWQPVNSPVFDEEGHLAYILHETKDVTAEVLGQPQAPAMATFLNGAHYRLQLFDPDGKLQMNVEFHAPDDASAEQKAQLLRCGQGAELWRGRKWVNTWAGEG
jgi:hypothetical protein